MAYRWEVSRMEECIHSFVFFVSGLKFQLVLALNLNLIDIFFCLFFFQNTHPRKKAANAIKKYLKYDCGCLHSCENSIPASINLPLVSQLNQMNTGFPTM
jgi:hypothetical protein